MQENQTVFEDLSEDTYDMISVMSHSAELAEYKKESKNARGGSNMCQAIKEMIEDGRQEGIKVLVQSCCEFGISKEDTIHKVKEKYKLTQEQATEKMTLYWNK